MSLFFCPKTWRACTGLALLSLLSVAGCTDDSATVKTLRAHGFTDITTTGYDAFACSEDDSFSTGFRAKNPAGEYVTGTVCCGLFKNCTVRF